MNTPFLLTSREAANALAISERTLFSLRRSGQIIAVQIGKCVRFSEPELKRFIASRETVEGQPR